ncbi:MAG: PIN domain-containing protein [Candidatus Pseudobacter hemicellulosilyticus]|uniref:PIN domain-containing protein n=1 Tax=Candidatus Pseudobacter hemicellulosilyticus TaxID=3121375 RepID=A0AAJ5WVY6_9BACT|nr:MAG: PIN domain-containing protein [Pseudobacter sp.]
MASKVFLDANILLDFTLKREAYPVARKIMELAVNGQVQAFITPSIVHIVGYWLTKAYGNAKAKELLLTLLADVSVIDIDHEITLTALHSKIKDIEDALQYYTAIHHKVDYFLSRDKDLQKASIPTLPVYTPDEFLKEAAGE